MKKKVTEKDQNQKIVKKKVYTPPILTVYGKLTELTAGGVGSVSEGGSSASMKRP